MNSIPTYRRLRIRALAEPAVVRRGSIVSGGGRLLAIAAIAIACTMGCGGSGGDVKPGRHRRAVERIAVSVVGVHDGDTLTGLTSGREQIKVRIEGIDAPELGQPFGSAAKRELSEKVFGKQVEILTSHNDLYGRRVGRVLVSGRDVGAEMVHEGFAWHATHFSHDKHLAAAEAHAKRAKAGLWADKSPEPPWEYRKHREIGRAHV